MKFSSCQRTLFIVSNNASLQNETKIKKSFEFCPIRQLRISSGYLTKQSTGLIDACWGSRNGQWLPNPATFCVWPCRIQHYPTNIRRRDFKACERNSPFRCPFRVFHSPGLFFCENYKNMANLFNLHNS